MRTQNARLSHAYPGLRSLFLFVAAFALHALLYITALPPPDVRLVGILSLLCHKLPTTVIYLTVVQFQSITETS
jgi:hypothetical protein